MPVTRKYACDDCDYEWTYLHLRSDEPYPDCPKCRRMADASLPTSFAITTVKAKAVDMAQKAAEESFGMTDMNDNLREGDIAAKAPPKVQTAEAEALTRMMIDANPELTPAQAEGVKGFWQNGIAGASPEQVAQVVGPAAAIARASGADPVELVHKADKAHADATGRRGMNLDVVSRSKMEIPT